MRTRRRSAILANILIWAGVLLLLSAPAYAGWQWWRTTTTVAQVRQRLIALTPDVPVFLTPIPTATPARPTTREAIVASPALPTPRRTTAPTPTAPGASPTATPVPPTPTPDRGAPPVRLVIPALGIDTPVVEVRTRLVDRQGQLVSTWETADYAAGYHVGSAYPGQVGNLVLSGHNNIKGQVFRPISALGEPDVPFPRGALAYVVDARDRVFVYAFEEMVKVREAGAPLEERIRNAQYMAPTEDPILTLITCWPLNSNTHRIIVRARLVGETDIAQLQNISPIR